MTLKRLSPYLAVLAGFLYLWGGCALAFWITGVPG